ncbi:DNA polymerase delta small subunit [Golovinomyces cichoracearum]|uniref:DNA-directed DNA polymerase n=1 Tax=Golovinomyces cichoracearum TaxID=62708 RepID=A0A420HJT3_9PEZI|nr:DNA polymerase delta small subunit [Golovinomyces cichoracearum]
MTAQEEGGSLLRAVSRKRYETISRQSSLYKPHDTFFLKADKQYKQQYGDMYFLRLAKLKPAVDLVASESWDELVIAGESVKKAERVLDVRQGSLCWVSGTVYVDMPLKPNILDDIAKDHWASALPPRQKYLSSVGEELVMLEDESGRLRLTGAPLKNQILVTGCVIAVMGTENSNGDFEVVDIKIPDLPPQTERRDAFASKNKNRDQAESIKNDDFQAKDTTEPTSHGKKIAIVSGLGFSGTDADHSVEIQLLVEYLIGEAFDPTIQNSVSQISRLIIAGNSITPDDIKVSHEITSATRKPQKKYGYDSSSYNPTPIAHLDYFLSCLLPSLPVTLIPGATDPANVSLPQQPLHPALFPLSRIYGSPLFPDRSTDEPGWFDPVTNPWDGEIEGWRFLGTGGQNVDDIFKYLESENRLEVLEALCRWRCCAPTAPDTLSSYPFQDDDPFVLDFCPHIFFVGSQPKFETSLIEGPDGQTVRLIAIPKFSETGELVLIDSETLETSIVKFIVT